VKIVLVTAETLAGKVANRREKRGDCDMKKSVNGEERGRGAKHSCKEQMLREEILHPPRTSQGLKKVEQP